MSCFICPAPVIRGMDFSYEEIENARDKKKLLSLTVLMGNLCNLSCLYCYRDAGKISGKSLTLYEWEKILLEAQSLGARTVWIPCSGEPFLDPVFYDARKNQFPFIDLANSLGLRVVFFTNGTFITERNADILFKKQVSIITKLNSFKPEVQDFLCGHKRAWKKLWQGLKILIKAGFNSNEFRLGIDSVIVRQNYAEIPDIFRFSRERNIIPYITTELHGGRGIVNGEVLDVPRKELKDLFSLLAGIDLNYNHVWVPKPPIAGGVCKQLLYSLVVDSQGDIFICPGITKIRLGNVKDNFLKEVLENSELVDKMRNFKLYANGACKKCQYLYCVYGCRLSAYAAGDLFGDDPQCWHKTEEKDLEK